MTLFLRASGLILLSAIGVSTIGFQQTLRRALAARRGRARKVDDCVLAIRRARRYGPFRGNCLSQSLALAWMLRRAGHDATVQIGVKTDGGKVLAHAWVELAGEAIDPAAIAGEYVPLHA